MGRFALVLSPLVHRREHLAERARLGLKDE